MGMDIGKLLGNAACDDIAIDTDGGKTTVVNFTNVLGAALARADPNSAKKTVLTRQAFGAFGIFTSKSFA